MKTVRKIIIIPRRRNTKFKCKVGATGKTKEVPIEDALVKLIVRRYQRKEGFSNVNA